MRREPPLYTYTIPYADAVTCLDDFAKMLSDDDFLRKSIGVMRTEDTWALRQFVSKLKDEIEINPKAEISASDMYRGMIKALPTIHQHFISEELYLELLTPIVELCFGRFPKFAQFAQEVKSFWSTAAAHSRKRRLM